MTCQEYLDRLLAGLAEDASEAAAAEHEAACAACGARGASMRAALAGIAALPAGTPAGFARGAMSKVSSARAPWEPATLPWMERIAAWLTPAMGQLAAGAALLVVGAVLVSGLFRSKTVPPTEVAKLTAQAGGVQVTKSGDVWHVTVPDAGYAQVAMGKAADVTLAEGTAADLKGDAQVDLVRGEVRLDVHHDQVGAQGFRVVTPHCRVLVTGTEFAVRVVGDQTQVTLYRGHVRVEGAQVVEMQAGERVMASALFVKLVTAAARPAWLTLPTTAEADPQPIRALRPSAPPLAGTSAVPARPAPVEGTALPEVPANANVHEPFRPER